MRRDRWRPGGWLAVALCFLLSHVATAQEATKPVPKPATEKPAKPAATAEQKPATGKATEAQDPAKKPTAKTPAKGPAQEQDPKKDPAKQDPAKAKKGAETKQKPKDKPQGPDVPRRKFVELTTPDGSRFLLVQDPTVAHIHWAIASWADGRFDPPGLPGLTLATAEASLAGTWATGSLDPQAERAAMAELDAGWQQQLAKPGNKQIAAEVRKLDRKAARFGDRRTFRRVLAAAPAFQPEVLDREPLAIFTLTTIEPALETVARLLLERREDQALRGLARAWLPSVVERVQDHALHPRRRLHAEALALMIPTSKEIARLEAPPFVAPDRTRAHSTWQASQHPRNTVHVLFGKFDTKRTTETLNAVFAGTQLNAPTYRPAPPGTLRGQRRSIVPGIASGGCTLAWKLPPVTDPTGLELARRWLMDTRGPLYRTLAKKRPRIAIECRAPWPMAESGQTLLMLDIQEPKGKPGLANEVIATLRTILEKPMKGGVFFRNYLDMAKEWNERADQPRGIAISLAERALMWPDQRIRRLAPRNRTGKQVQPMLRAIFASYPAVVEAK